MKPKFACSLYWVSCIITQSFSALLSTDKETSPGVTCHALEFSEKTVFGRKIKFCAEADQAGILSQYLQQAAPTGMTWQ